MGIYFNPGNESFLQSKNSRIYVDKTELINELNNRLSTDDKCVAVSHARRFGKSHAAGMIDAYYSRGCDSAELFEDTKLATNPAYKKHMNKYNVIHLDISSFWDDYKVNIIEKIKEYVVSDLRDEFEENVDFSKKFSVILMSVYKLTGIQFVIIIDEWDCVIRNSDDQNLIHNYLQFLHSLFKSEESKYFLALAYITGILPIKKYGSHSALNMFMEYSMTDPGELAEFFGFTEEEVKGLCEEYAMNFEEVKAWYDGYDLISHSRFGDKRYSIYSPKSVVEAMLRHKFGTYWNRTETYEALKIYIQMNMDGLKDSVIQMLAGEGVRINTGTFSNDMTTFATKDDVLTLLVHLGYLTYNSETEKVTIPNKEVSQEYLNAISTMDWHEVMRSVENSRKLV